MITSMHRSWDFTDVARVLALVTLSTSILARTSVRAETVAATMGTDAWAGGLIGSVMYGWSFTTNVDINVTDLGYWDLDGNGLRDDHQVGIWADGGALLGSATVQRNDPILNGFRYTSSPPISLIAGQTYVIAGFDIGGGYPDAPLRDQTVFNGFSVASEITYRENRFRRGATFDRPDTYYIAGSIGFFGPNFQFTAAPVPEANTIGLLAMSGLLFGTRRRKKIEIRSKSHSCFAHGAAADTTG